MAVPDIPGVQVPEGLELQRLREHVRDMCKLHHTRFPGAQPVTFSQSSIESLKKENYWVCEKSDGRRVLVLIVVPPTTRHQEVYLIDRKNKYYRIHGLYFPRQDRESCKAQKTAARRDHTLLDGELVFDRVRQGQSKLRLLLFDCIVLEHNCMAEYPLSYRYGCLVRHIFLPYAERSEQTKETTSLAPLEVMVKPMDLACNMEKVIRDKSPSLLHDSDGYIFTRQDGGYVYGSDPHILKWKPPRENTIDFKLCVRFPTSQEQNCVHGLDEKPFLELYQHVMGDQYQFFDWFEMLDEEWEKWRKAKVQLDDQIVECAWHPPSPYHETVPTWHIKRIRDDKPRANHYTTVNNVIQSILDGVELEQVAPEIREEWIARVGPFSHPAEPQDCITDEKRLDLTSPPSRGNVSAQEALQGIVGPETSA